MSRCFPFPPPGYERKHRTDDLVLLKEAKRKEKKHKKDKERKKDKDGHREKHRDKKEKQKGKKEKHKEKRKDKEELGKDREKSSISEELTVAGKLEDRNGGKASQSCLPTNLYEETKFVLELDRRIKNDERGAIRNSSQLLVDNKNQSTDRKIDPQGVKHDLSATKMLPITKARVECVATPVHEQNGRWEGREKYNEIGAIKQKDRVTEKGKYYKEKKNDKNVEIKNENKNSIQIQFKDDEPGGFTGKRVLETNSNAANEENVRKRKELANESEMRPNKIPKPGAIENGKRVVPFQSSTKSCHDIPNREMLMNGLTESHKASSRPAKAKPSQDDSHWIEELMGEASRKPPHPDSKYLDEVLTVPKIEKCYEATGEEEWLLSKKAPPAGNSKVKQQHVWSEAVHIQSADVCALPYVLPY